MNDDDRLSENSGLVNHACVRGGGHMRQSPCAAKKLTQGKDGIRNAF